MTRGQWPCSVAMNYPQQGLRHRPNRRFGWKAVIGSPVFGAEIMAGIGLRSALVVINAYCKWPNVAGCLGLGLTICYKMPASCKCPSGVFPSHMSRLSTREITA